MAEINFFLSFLIAAAAIIPLNNTFAFESKPSCSDPHLSIYLREMAIKYSNISRLTSIGRTIEGRDLLVMIISDEPNNRPLLRPQVKFVGNIMGNTGPSCDILLKLINHLLTNYDDESSVERRIIKSTEIHILPNMNPDGFRKAVPGKCDGAVGKYNGGGKLLNRDFPHVFESESIEEDYRQPETEAVAAWTMANNFLTSISYFTGAKVVSYPFDSVPAKDSRTHRNKPNLTPDDDIFQHLSSIYVSNVNDLHEWHCPRLEKVFHDGKINGAEWMAASGTMMDYNYIVGTFELLVGVSCCRNENNEIELENIWKNNKIAMLKIIEQSEYAFRGLILDSETNNPIPNALLVKLNPNPRLNKEVQPWYTSYLGEFWRIVLPGKYLLEITAFGYKKKTIPFEIIQFQPTNITIQLEPTKPKLISKRYDPSSSTFLESTTTISPEILAQAVIADGESPELQNDAAYNSKEHLEVENANFSKESRHLLTDAINSSLIGLVNDESSDGGSTYFNSTYKLLENGSDSFSMSVFIIISSVLIFFVNMLRYSFLSS